MSANDKLLAQSDRLLSLLRTGILEAIATEDGLDSDHGDYLLKEIAAWQAEFVGGPEDIDLGELLYNLGVEVDSGLSDEYVRGLLADASAMLEHLSEVIYKIDQAPQVTIETEIETIGPVSKLSSITTLNDLATLTSFSDPIVTNVAAHNVAHHAAAYKKYIENKYRGETIYCEYIRELFVAVDKWVSESAAYVRGDPVAELSEAPVG